MRLRNFLIILSILGICFFTAQAQNIQQIQSGIIQGQLGNIPRYQVQAPQVPPGYNPHIAQALSYSQQVRMQNEQVMQQAEQDFARIREENNQKLQATRATEQREQSQKTVREKPDYSLQFFLCGIALLVLVFAAICSHSKSQAQKLSRKNKIKKPIPASYTFLNYCLQHRFASFAVIFGLSAICATANAYLKTPPQQTAQVQRQGFYQMAGSSSGDVQYFMKDGNENTRQLVNANGQVTANYNYNAYGESPQQGTLSNPGATTVLYNGQQWDPALQQYYLRSRYYNPQNGQFTSMDSYRGNYFDPQSLNKYSYCANNPVNLSDASGHDYTVVSMVGNAAMGMMLDSIPNITLAQVRNTPDTYSGVNRNQLPPPSPALARALVLQNALAAEGSLDWQINKVKDNFKAGDNKCNKFVYDITDKSGAPTLTGIVRKRIPTAGEFADPGVTVFGWIPTAIPSPGDTIAEMHGGGNQANNTGHVGIVVEYDAATGNGKTVSQSTVEDKVVNNDWGFRAAQKKFGGMTYRRYEGQ